MASPVSQTERDAQQNLQPSESSPEAAFQEAQKWIEAATGRRFGDKDFRSGLENGILLCELLSSIKPGLVKKINRLPTPIAGLDNLTLFLRGCEELGLKGSQLFDPGDLQDTSIRANPKGSDCNRKLKNVLITIYWLGKAANSCTTYNGPTLDLKEFEGLLSQMRKEAEDMESPKRNVRDSGYIDCWDSERSDSLSPPRHGRDDSFDSLDSFGSRSQQTPSPDVVIRGSSDGRGSDSETDAPHRKLPDMRKDDMLARRTSYNEPRTMMPFNQYLPNKSNQSAYVPASLRKKRAEREDSRKSWSTATSPIGGERPFSHPEAIQEEGLQPEEGEDRTRALLKTVTGGGTTCLTPPLWEGKDEQEIKKLERLEKAGIRVLPAAIRYSSLKPAGKEPPRGPTPDIILRKDNEFSRMQQEHESDSGEEEEAERRVPDVEKDDLASRRAQMSRGTPRMQQQFLPSSCSSQDRERWERIRRSSQQAALERQQQQVLSETKDSSRLEPNAVAPKEIPPVQPQLQEGQGVSPQALPNALRDDLARRRAHSGPPPQRENLSAFMQASITQSDLEKWERLKMTVETSETEAPSQDSSFGMVARKGSSWVPEEWEEQRKEAEHGGSSHAIPNVQKDDLARRRAQSSLLSQRDAPQSCFQASITQSDLEKWDRLKMTVETSEAPSAPVCQACLEKSWQPPAILADTAARDDLASRRARAHQRPAASRQRFVHFGPVTEIDQKCWEKLSIARPGEEEQEAESGAGPGNESLTLRRLLSAAAVATPTIGLGSQLTERAASPSGLIGGEAARLPMLPELVHRENDALDQKLAQYKRQEEEEEAEEVRGERSPDLEKDDMLARRTKVFHKSTSSPAYNRFLPLPGSKVQAPREGALSSPKALGKTVDDPAGRGESPKEEVFPDRPRDGKELRPVLRVQEPQGMVDATAHSDQDIAVPVSAIVKSSDEEECEEERPLPNLEKDDMHARRTGAFQKAAGPAFNSFLPVPGSVRHKSAPVSAAAGSTSSKPVEQGKIPPSESPSITYSAEMQQGPPAVITMPLNLAGKPGGGPEKSLQPPRGIEGEEAGEDRKLTSLPVKVGRDDMWSWHSHAPPARTSPSPPCYLPAPGSQQEASGRAEAEGEELPWGPSGLDDEMPPIFSHRAASVSDDPESVSMIDMRCEEEAILQPYSQARCELLQNQYNKVREEEDHWQDDLARWKNRRRSASQDLIKKEEERKMMEKLMTVDGAQGHRRKSIKTYKEIVEEKERREQELHEAYRRARTPQEAAAVLQHYALRFTISEAVLERLQLPKQADPGAPPAEPSGPLPLPQPATPPLAPGPMKYLRQQSAPMPKFTSTVEATVVGVTPTQATAAAAPTHPPTRMVLPKTVPLLAPKPYITPRSSQTGLRSIKADGMVRVNGETGEVSGRLENSWGGAKDNGASPVKEAASLPLSPPTTLSSPKKEPEDEMGGRDVGRGAGDEPPAVQEAACVTCLGESEEATPPALAEVEATPIRPSSLPTDLQRESVVSESAEAGNADTQEREDEAKPAAVQQPVTGDGVQDVASAEQEAEEKGPHVRMERGCVVTTTILTELTQTQILPSNMPEMKRAGDEEAPSPRRSEAPPPNAQPPCEAPVSELAYSAGNSRLRWEFFTLPDDQEKDLVNIPTPVLSLPKRVDHWSWDPDEERRRQERWQQEQERMLQEKYQREQEKLKQEWERAQKEVEEEERKYHEEERKILEETVTPLTPTLTPTLPSIFGDSAAPPSPQNTIVRSLADWDRKQELLEKQANEPQQDNNVAQDTGTRNGSSANLTLRSPIPQSTTQTTAVTPGLQNGQQAPLDPSQSSVPQLQFIQDASWASKRPEAQQQDEVWKKTASLDRNWSSQPAQSGGMKRSGSCENVGTHPSKSSPFSSATQPPSPNRSVSGKKLCSSCTHPLGKGAAMIIETLGLYFHIQCFKCGICKGQLGDTSTGTDVRIRNGLLNCHECYIKSRAAGQPTTL
ncbi:LIM and calponin homology domains-containing protein 1a isoform X3 [Brienomyrus brachyistius]|uniref:LIM and calponin homology domains-containing protein 1a isoform X3 n=1 Tax=Brienomyrus brachyistius TaxID=42636 RepID=UPI0020B416CD|nr:LIM and calponin homology domains-containing protein 1a isoform X3 [Brienomyrus brachyistius]